MSLADDILSGAATNLSHNDIRRAFGLMQEDPMGIVSGTYLTSNTTNSNYELSPWDSTYVVTSTVERLEMTPYRGDPLLEGAARKETPEEWLYRRVKEICWRPA